MFKKNIYYYITFSSLSIHIILWRHVHAHALAQSTRPHTPHARTRAHTRKQAHTHTDIHKHLYLTKEVRNINVLCKLKYFWSKVAKQNQISGVFFLLDCFLGVFVIVNIDMKLAKAGLFK